MGREGNGGHGTAGRRLDAGGEIKTRAGNAGFDLADDARVNADRQSEVTLADADGASIFCEVAHGPTLAHYAIWRKAEFAHGAFVRRRGTCDTDAMRLRQIREAKGLNQKQLADMIGVDAATVSRAENMDSSAKMTTYVACADALGVSLADLFSDDRAAMEEMALSLLRSLPCDRRQQALAILRAMVAPPAP